MRQWDDVWFEKDRYNPKLKRFDRDAAERGQRMAAAGRRRTYVPRPQFMPER